MDKTPHYLFIMLGFLGSGKSYVSRWLAPKVNGIHIRVDDLRLEMFGEDRPGLYTPENKALVNNAIDYMVKQAVSAVTVVLDGNHISAEYRKKLADLAKAQGARPVIVHIQTPLETAKQRTITREQTEGHKLFAPNLVEDMARRLEPPTPEEQIIVIDGLATAEGQQAQFDEQFAHLQAERLQ